MKRYVLVATVAMLGLSVLLNGCGGGGGGGSTTVDTSYAFTGAQPGVSYRAAGYGLLRGSLLTSSGTGAGGVTVTLYRLVQSRQSGGSITTTSSSSGSYVFGNLTPGAYRAVVGSQTADVTVTADADTTQSFSNVATGSTNRFKWTLMVFIDANQDPRYADSNLEPYAVENVNQLESLPDSSQVAIVVLMSRLAASDTTSGNWTGARRFRVTHDSDPHFMSSARTASEGGSAEALGTVDMGSAANVKSFITWAQANYPADHYAVDLWDHGSGVLRSRAAGATGLTRGILFDDATGSYVTTAQLSDALVGTAKIDLVMFDACAMQMLEIAYQIRNNCDVVVGSEDLTPGDGYPYDQIFDLPISNPSVGTEELASHIVSGFNTFYTAQRTDSCQSALRTSQVANLAQVVSTYGTTLQNSLNVHRTAIGNARAASQQYGGSSSQYEGYRDLVDFATRVAATTSDSALIAGRDAVKTAFSAALIANGRYGTSESGSNGLGIWLPSANTWRNWRAVYATNAFAQSTAWSTWLSALHTQ